MSKIINRLGRGLRDLFGPEGSTKIMNYFEGKAGGFEEATNIVKAVREGSLNRRTFLIQTLLAGATVTFSACAVKTDEIDRIVDRELGEIKIPDKLPGKKIQSPEYYGLGPDCLLGVAYGGRHYGLQYVDELFKRQSGVNMSFYVNMSKYSQMPYGMIRSNIGVFADKGIIPMVTYAGDYGYGREGEILEMNKGAFDAYLRGKFDKNIAEDAKKLRKEGEKYGGFFLRVFQEMNLRRKLYDWASRNRETYIKGWRKIWYIMDNEGANEYATWVWNPYGAHSGHTDYSSKMEQYYPGDKYVDWVGMNAYNFYGISANYGKRNRSFRQLLNNGYRRMKKYHSNKPLIIPELGCNEFSGKPKWFKDMFKTIDDWHYLKAIAMFSLKWSHDRTKNMDTRIDSSRESEENFKNAIKNAKRVYGGKVPYKNYA